MYTPLLQGESLQVIMWWTSNLLPQPLQDWGIVGIFTFLYAKPGDMPCTVGTFLWSKSCQKPAQTHAGKCEITRQYYTKLKDDTKLKAWLLSSTSRVL